MRIIHGTLADLGYANPHLPLLLRLGQHTVSKICFLAQGLKPGSSFVYRVDCGQEQAILKLNCTDREVTILQASMLQFADLIFILRLHAVFCVRVLCFTGIKEPALCPISDRSHRQAVASADAEQQLRL